MNWKIRPFEGQDQAILETCDFTFTTQKVLSLFKSTHGLHTQWALTERELEGQYTGNYSLSADEWAVMRARSEGQSALLLVAEIEGAPIALLDIGFDDWNETARIWNLYIDAKHREQGLGRMLIARAEEWARMAAHKARALVVETQTNNYPACQFYSACGFELSGIDDHFYSNQDREAKMGIGEVALFWYKPL